LLFPISSLRGETMKTITTTFLFVTIAVFGLFATGCPERKSIADIERDPAKYQDKEVVIAGVVRDSYGFGIPGTNIGGGAYKIDDGTGTIWVLVTDGNVPSKGAEIGVKAASTGKAAIMASESMKETGATKSIRV